MTDEGKSEPSIVDRLSAVRLFAMDVDGVLTDGGIIVPGAEGEVKRFHVSDGLGLQLAQLAGIEVAWISGRKSAAVERRAAELHITHVQQGVGNKAVALATLAGDLGLSKSEVAYMGDDWNDLPAFTVCGVRLAPANAPAEIKGIVDLVTEHCGGSGAVREACDTILKARGSWNTAVEKYVASIFDNT